MEWTRSRRWLRMSLLMRQNRAVIVFITLWFTVNAILFVTAQHLAPRDALLALFFFRDAPGAWGHFYDAFSDFVVFGLVVSVVFTNFGRKYNPEETCRLLAARLRDHVVLVGYTHFGQRVAEALAREGIPTVVVDPDRDRVAALVRNEQPLIVGTGRDAADLAAAGIQHARLVVIASDDIATPAVASRLVRESNRECDLIVRCHDADVGEALGRTYSARVISTSRSMARHIRDLAERHGARSVVVVGANQVGLAIGNALAERGVAYTIVEPEARAAESAAKHHTVVKGPPIDRDVLTAAGIKTADLVVIADEDLEKNLVTVDRIRDLNQGVRIVARAFDDAAAAVLSQKPFECAVISTSRHAVEMLVRDGAFRRAGIATISTRASTRSPNPA